MDNETSKFVNNGGKRTLRLAALSLDLIVSTMASMLAMLMVRWITNPIFQFGHHVYIWVLLGFVASLISLLICKTHRILFKFTTIRSVGRLTYATLLKEMLMSLVVFLGGVHYDMHMHSDVLLLLLDLLLTLVMLTLTRVIVIAIYKELRDTPEKNVDRTQVIIYGTSDKSVAMVIRLENSSHYSVVGYLTRDKSMDGLIIQNVRTYYFDDDDALEHLKIKLGFSCILFAREEDSEMESANDGLVQMSFRHNIHCLSAPKIEQIDLGGISMQAASSVVSTSIDFIPDGMSSFERNTKRIIDFVLASILLVVFSPLFLICYIALKMDDGGPAIYKQERIGRFGRPFFIYKFRSMKVDAESAGPALYSGDNDPRLTRVGGFLRRHHLDELPQLFNVWRGDMAFVGPRPERKFYIDQIMERDPRYYFLYQIRPGVTSYATLRNGYTDTMEKMLRRLEFDLYYLAHRSWWFDIKVLWQTFINIVFGKIF